MLPDLDEQIAVLRKYLKPQIEEGFADGATIKQKARAAYLTICLGIVNEFRSKDAEKWKLAMDSLEDHQAGKICPAAPARSRAFA